MSHQLLIIMFIKCFCAVKLVISAVKFLITIWVREQCHAELMWIQRNSSPKTVLTLMLFQTYMTCSIAEPKRRYFKECFCFLIQFKSSMVSTTTLDLIDLSCMDKKTQCIIYLCSVEESKPSRFGTT